VPREPLPLRARAVNNIRTIYEQSDRVVVLDEELLDSCISSSSTPEILMRIELSGWMRRLWTLHEQAAATDLWFQFADGAVSQNDLLARASAENHQFDVVTRQTASLVAIGSRLRDAQEAAYITLARLWNSLGWRETSWVEDETICMANILRCERQTVEKLQSMPFDAAFSDDMARLMSPAQASPPRQPRPLQGEARSAR
jgi:hypothetical protein